MPPPAPHRARICISATPIALPWTQMTSRTKPATELTSAAHGERSKYDVVAVGASAGGLKSLFKLLGPLPASFPISILVVLHLSPGHPSHLAEVLERKLILKVHQA